MAIFYKGAAVGTQWHKNDARNTGFTPWRNLLPSTQRLINHIAKGIVTSPYISLTRSYAVALGYALMGTPTPTPTNPAYVYEIEFREDLLHAPLRLVDPVREVSTALQLSYLHEGLPSFLLGVVDPNQMGNFLTIPAPQPPPAPPRPPLLTDELDTLVRALRDAEILIEGPIPANYVTNRWDIY